MKITLISPYEDITAFGLRSISACLKREGIEPQILFLPDKKFDAYSSSGTKLGDVYQYDNMILNQVIDFCQDSDAVGISLFTCHFDRVAQLTESLKRRHGIPIIWGGIHPTIKPEESLQYCEIVCRGEGEEAMIELLKRMQQGEDYFTTRNFWFKRNGSIIKNELRPVTENLDKYPFPDYSLKTNYIYDADVNKIVSLDHDMLKKNLFPLFDKPSYMTLTARGCPRKCSYCMSFKGLYEGQKYIRQRSPSHIVEEIKKVKGELGYIERVQFLSDSFLAQPAGQIKEFAALYKKEIGLPFRCLIDPATVTEEKLECLVDAGMYEVHMGIQTACERTKKLYNRHVANQTVLEAARLINKFKGSLTVIYDFILDNPYETKEDIADTLRFVLRLPRPFQMHLFSLVFLPGTELYERARKDGILNDEEKDVYRKQFQFLQIRYLNLIFLLVNHRVPVFLLKPLLNRQVIRIFERESINRVLSNVVEFVRSAKKRVPRPVLRSVDVEKAC